jgi:hypothetical protein
MARPSQRAQPFATCGALPRAALLCTQLTWRRVALEDVQSTFRIVIEPKVVALLLIRLFFIRNIRGLGSMPH